MRRISPRRGDDGREKSHKSLLVRNIAFDCRAEELRLAFERFGPVSDIYIPRDNKSGEPRAFAFVEFVSEHDAEEAQRSMDKSLFGGRKINVVVSHQQSKKIPRHMLCNARNPPTREASGSKGRAHERSRSRSPRRRPSDSRSRYRLRSYSPAPRRRGAEHSASPRRRQEERSTRGDKDGKSSRRSNSPRYDRNRHTEERRRGRREVSRSRSPR